MAKLWQGFGSGQINKQAEDFNSSISFDKKLVKQDITGSIAHAFMLGEKNIIPKQDADCIIQGLSEILDDVTSGKLPIDESAEDIHTFVEQTLIAKVGEVGKKLHTARSRNDQVALDMKMYAREQIDEIISLLKSLIGSINAKAQEYKGAVVSGYTHLQRAQPITFGHQLCAYSFMFLRDIDRLKDCKKRLNLSPIGCCALAGTTYDTDRVSEAKKLGFSGVVLNSIDGVSDRDYCVELLSCLSLIMVHLSRFSEEIILWSSWEFKYVTLSDEFTTGSSIMPQKKNSDMAELTRGKSGRVFGDLMAMLTVLKGLPLAYNKDMQEDKECVFDGIDTVKACLGVFIPMVASITANTENMLKSAQQGFINATDLADYLAKKGIPFRTAYKTVGEIVRDLCKSGKTLEQLSLSEYKKYNPLFEQDVYAEISLDTCVAKRISLGGTSPASVEKQIEYISGCLK